MVFHLDSRLEILICMLGGEDRSYTWFTTDERNETSDDTAYQNTTDGFGSSQTICEIAGTQCPCSCIDACSNPAHCGQLDYQKRKRLCDGTYQYPKKAFEVKIRCSSGTGTMSSLVHREFSPWTLQEVKVLGTRGLRFFIDGILEACCFYSCGPGPWSLVPAKRRWGKVQCLRARRE